MSRSPLFVSRPPRISRLRLAAVPAASLAVSITLLVAPADAAPLQAPSNADATSSTPAPLSSEARGAGRSVQDALDAYWTPARMAAATPARVPVTRRSAPGSTNATVGAPLTTAPASPAFAPTVAAAAQALLDGVDVAASPTVGRIFFHDPVDGRDHSCSGSALNSVTKRLVITAGHCVHGGEDGEPMEDWIFVPFYDHGDEPYGSFAARTYRTFDAWREDSSDQHDVAMVTTWSNEFGQLLVNAVGGNGLSVNYPKKIYLTALAYPADPPYDGAWQHYCRGTTKTVIDGRIRLECGFTGGASGGPWLRAYSDSTKVGYVNGVFSTLASSGWNRSPYFDTKIMTMYENTVDD
jgi:V8-like Glu-specific endopeptidase